ncbi:MAG: DoxX family protein, partial [Siphonobacter sp.]
PNRDEYNQLYYGLRVLIRYRLAAGILAYGFLKFFPEQAPLPSLSHLNTNYGDFTAWKLFSISLGVVPGYESFLGAVELAAGLLLLYRKTTTLATLIIIPFTGNVFFSNLAYEGGEALYSFYLISLALFLFAFDAVRLFTLVSLEKKTYPNQFQPHFVTWQKYARIMVKTGFFFVFIFFYGYTIYAAHRQGSYQYPQQAGLAQAAGLYNVREFKKNGQIIPYSQTDSSRWRDVVFEKWATISIRTNQPAWLDGRNTEEIYVKDQDRTYESAGTTGRHYYAYQIDSVRHELHVKSKNPVVPTSLTWHYQRPAPGIIVLSGLDQQHDSLRVVLEKRDKKYLIFEAQKTGRRKGLTL